MSLKTMAKALALAPLFLFLAHAHPLAGEKVSPAKGSVLLITVDSLRPDHLGCYGYGKPTSPWIDRLAREGTLFLNAFSHGGWTSPAMVSLFTGLYPSVHGVEGRKDHFPCREQAPFASWVKRGYRVPASSALEEEPNYSRLGFERDPDYGSSPDQTVSWLRRHRSRPFFCWIHINKTPHLPYNPPESYRELFWPQDLDPALLTSDESLKTVQSKVIIPKGTISFSPQLRPAVVALYDGEVRTADDAVGGLYRFLEAEGMLDSTVIVLTADHGEDLLDHGFVGHASTNWDGTLFDEIIRVPLIIRYPPALPAGKVVDEIVEAIDILPTLREILDIPCPQTFSQGRSVVPLLAGRKQDWKDVAFSENSLCGYQCNQVPEKGRTRLASVRSHHWKLSATHTPDGSRFSLFDLKADPQEKQDCLHAQPEVGRRLMELLLDTYSRNRILRKELLESCNCCQE